MTLMQTYERLEEWLKNNYHFEDGHVLAIDKNPLSITVGYNIKGNYKANTLREILSFKITPNNLFEWDDIANEFAPSDEYVIECIDVFDVENGIGLQICGPPILTLAAESFTISDPEIIRTTFRPYVSDHFISINAPMEEIPRPHFWKQKLKELGFDIVFRYYLGEARTPEEIPYPNYIGYFIQHANKIKETQMGIGIEFLSMKDHQVLIGFSMHDEHLDDLWTALTTVLADIPEVKILCGNCEFTGKEWKEWLNKKLTLPSSNTEGNSL